MKHLKTIAGGLLGAGLVLIVTPGCQKSLATGDVLSPGTAAFSSVSDSALIAYKNSAHHPFVGYLVADGNDPAAAVDPANSPDSVDFLEFFSGRDGYRPDWRAAQAKGTRIVVCHFVSDAYFDGSVNDPSTPGSTKTTPTSTSTYNHWASAMYQQHIVQDSLDGIDMDIETGTLGGEVPNATCLKNLLISVAKYFGPNCTSASTVMGKKPVFFFDTDGSVGGGIDGSYYTNYKSNYDYVLFQAYTTGSHYWSGSGTSSFGPLVTAYGLSKLIFLVNGDSFSPTDPTVGNDLISYAQWVVSNNGAGVGAYRMSRDYNDVPSFTYSRQAIHIMNP